MWNHGRILGFAFVASHDLFLGKRVRSEAIACRILGSAFEASPRSVSGREGAPEELSEAMARRIPGSAFAAAPRFVPGREGAPEEPSEAMARRILGFALVASHDLFPGERVRQRSHLKPWFCPGCPY